jgi:hypothetical protein
MNKSKTEIMEANEEIKKIIKAFDSAKVAELFRALKKIKAGGNFRNVVTRISRIAEDSTRL